MPECRWHRDDCRHYPEKCDLCFTEEQCYRPVNERKTGIRKKADRPGRRNGAAFEYKNHKRNQAVLKSTESFMTPNSGALPWSKGDEQIKGLLRAMEELKTRTGTKAAGEKSFTIKKEWLTKLNREAKAENMEFWYLKFSFHEDDSDIYCITEQDMVMSMIKTMAEDRRNLISEKLSKESLLKECEFLKAELIAKAAEAEMYRAKLRECSGKDIFGRDHG